MSEPSIYHVIRRMTPERDAFLGTCVQCGRTHLPASATREYCDNPPDLARATDKGE